MTIPAPVPVSMRANARELRDMPCDSVEILQAKAILTPKEIGVWIVLRNHLWVYGDLPVAIRQLARIAGVGPKTFERMMPALSPFFDHDVDGRWRHLDLEDQRDAHATSPEGDIVVARGGFPAPRADIDPDLSRKRAEAGRRGGARSAQGRFARLIEGNPAEQQNAPDGDAKFEANEAKQAKQNDGSATAKGAVLLDFASGSRSQLASLDSSDSLEDSSKLASGARAGAASKTTDPQAKVVQANQANLLADTQAKSLEPTSAEERPVPQASGVAPVKDEIMIDALVRLGASAISAADAHRRLPAFRAAMAEGLDFFKDILPQVQAFARNKRRVENPANKHIMEDARAFHASRKATEAMNGEGKAIGGVFVDVDTPQWRAWLAHSKKPSMVSYALESDRTRKGKYCPSEWPPGHSP